MVWIALIGGGLPHVHLGAIVLGDGDRDDDQDDRDHDHKLDEGKASAALSAVEHTVTHTIMTDAERCGV